MTQNLSPHRLITLGLMAAYRSMSGWSGMTAHQTPDLFMTVTDLPYPVLNIACSPREDGRETAEALQGAATLADRHGVPCLWFALPDLPPEAGERRALLTAHGFAPLGTCTGMDLSLPGTLPEHPALVACAPVNSPEQLADWNRVAAAVFEYPDCAVQPMYEIYLQLGLGAEAPCRNFLLTEEGRPVGVASVFFFAALPGIATVANVATLPDRRGRGLGTALTLATLYEARRRGCEQAALLASAAGLGVYRGLGFQERFVGGIYLRALPSWSPAGGMRSCLQTGKEWRQPVRLPVLSGLLLARFRLGTISNCFRPVHSASSHFDRYQALMHFRLETRLTPETIFQLFQANA